MLWCSCGDNYWSRFMADIQTFENFSLSWADDTYDWEKFQNPKIYSFFLNWYHTERAYRSFNRNIVSVIRFISVVDNKLFWRGDKHFPRSHVISMGKRLMLRYHYLINHLTYYLDILIFVQQVHLCSMINLIKN